MNYTFTPLIILLCLTSCITDENIDKVDLSSQTFNKVQIAQASHQVKQKNSSHIMPLFKYMVEELDWSSSGEKSNLNIDQLLWENFTPFKVDGKSIFGIPTGSSAAEVDGVVMYVEGVYEDRIIHYGLDELISIAESGVDCAPFPVLAMSSIVNFNLYHNVIAEHEILNQFLKDNAEQCIDKSSVGRVPYTYYDWSSSVATVIAGEATIILPCSNGVSGGEDHVIPLPDRNTISISTTNRGSGGGPTPALSHPDLDIDVQIDASVYPCIAAMATSIINDIGSELFGLVGDHIMNSFTANNTSNLDVVVSTSLAGSSGRTQRTNTGPVFQGRISLNANLEGCTRDRIYATLVHELMHAHILQRFHELGGYSDAFLTEFPAFATAIQSHTFFELNSHEAMTQSPYFRDMVFAQRALNPRAGAEHAVLMTWGGLQHTNAFGNLSPDVQNNVGLIDMAAGCNPASGDTNDYQFINC